jgi:hypothetical protein
MPTTSSQHTPARGSRKDRDAVDDEGGFVAATAAEALASSGWSVGIGTSFTSVAARVGKPPLLSG